MTKPIRLAPSMREWNPLAKLEALPGYWRGKALARRMLAEQADNGKERDEHLRIAGECERKVKEIVE